MRAVIQKAEGQKPSLVCESFSFEEDEIPFVVSAFYAATVSAEKAWSKNNKAKPYTTGLDYFELVDENREYDAKIERFDELWLDVEGRRTTEFNGPDAAILYGAVVFGIGRLATNPAEIDPMIAKIEHTFVEA